MNRRAFLAALGLSPLLARLRPVAPVAAGPIISATTSITETWTHVTETFSPPDWITIVAKDGKAWVQQGDAIEQVPLADLGGGL